MLAVAQLAHPDRGRARDEQRVDRAGAVLRPVVDERPEHITERLRRATRVAPDWPAPLRNSCARRSVCGSDEDARPVRVRAGRTAIRADRAARARGARRRDRRRQHAGAARLGAAPRLPVVRRTRRRTSVRRCRGAPASNADVPGVLHPGIPFAVHTADGEPVTIGDRAGAGFRLPTRTGRLRRARLRRVRRVVRGGRADLRPPARPVPPRRRPAELAAARGSSSAARSWRRRTRARMAYETQLMTRFYLPREDVRVPLQRERAAYLLPYKGEASYWSVERRREDMLLVLRAAAAGRGRARRPGGVLGRARGRLPRRRAPRAPGRPGRRRAGRRVRRGVVRIG